MQHVLVIISSDCIAHEPLSHYIIDCGGGMGPRGAQHHAGAIIVFAPLVAQWLRAGAGMIESGGEQLFDAAR